MFKTIDPYDFKSMKRKKKILKNLGCRPRGSFEKNIGGQLMFSGIRLKGIFSK